MKKILALLLVLVLGLVVFSSCSKQAPKEETAKMTITIINKTGENVKDISLKERIGSKNQSWTSPELAADQEISFTIETVVEKGAPSLDFSYALENGNNMQTTIIFKGDQTITLTVSAEGSPEAEIVAK